MASAISLIDGNRSRTRRNTSTSQPGLIFILGSAGKGSNLALGQIADAFVYVVRDAEADSKAKPARQKEADRRTKLRMEEGDSHGRNAAGGFARPSRAGTR